MNDKFIEPEFNKSAFTCPHCQVVAKMEITTPQKIKQNIEYSLSFIQKNYSLQENIELRINNILRIVDYYESFANTFCVCQNCEKISIWVDEKMVYPKPLLTPPPNEDLSDDIKADYNEAALIVQDSPRGACALLRLALQKLMIELGKDKNLDKAIKGLIDAGIIDETLRQALDSVRVIGNNAVHPNELDIKDNKEIATALFDIVNFIAEKMISEKRRISKIYNKLPNSAKRENKDKNE